MPTEVIDLMQKTLEELKSDVRALEQRLQADVHRRHTQLREDHIGVHKKLTALSERVQSLEHSERITRWWFGGGGAVVALVVRELLVKYVL